MKLTSIQIRGRFIEDIEPILSIGSAATPKTHTKNRQFEMELGYQDIQ